MKVIAVTSEREIATVYIAETGKYKRYIEFVEALQAPYCRDERWILMVSTLFGCPVKCQICDAGGKYCGKLSKEQILAQIDYMVDKWYPDRIIPARKVKIQFARMGEPSFNMAVLDALEELPKRYRAPGLMPSLSTIAPKGTDVFFKRLIDIKNSLYSNGKMQFQFSIHTTDEALRDKLIPVKKWDFNRIAKYGESFRSFGDRKITLNFALVKGMPIESDVLLRYFDPEDYLIKITPVNPTCSAVQNKMVSYIEPKNKNSFIPLLQKLKDAGYEVIVSIGETRENLVGSNCGQYVLKYLETQQEIKDGYTYQVQSIEADSAQLKIMEII